MKRASRVAAAAVWFACATGAQAAHPHALWRVVHDICVPLKRVAHVSAPCLSVDLKTQVAVVPNPRSPTEVLLAPTVRVTGIEDPALLAPDAPNYWAAAWAARRYVASRAGVSALPAEDVAMAVNAIPGRSQDQLHIHVDCIKPDVRATLASDAGRLGAQWKPLRVHGGTWWARRLVGEALAPDPFRLLAGGVPGAAENMGAWTLVAAGLPGEGGEPSFALLARRTAPGFNGHGEFLLDKRCAVLAGG
ncbi:MAG: CDP-diacylglycerol diphosphatase [Caulobacteraceae bacterium]|nr:CDP-diacylglycerol diphosphatase [Caulobacter sp.]